MFTKKQSEKYREDNFNTKDDGSEKLFCGNCKKMTKCNTTSGFNGDSWSVTACSVCGAGDNNLYEDRDDFIFNILNNNK